MSTKQDPLVQAVPAAQWAAVITRSLSQRGEPTQVVPPDATPEGEEAELVVWGTGAAAFCCKKVQTHFAMSLAANDIHNPNYPDQA